MIPYRIRSIAVAVICSMLCAFFTACDSTKTEKTIKDFRAKAREARIYIRNIAQANVEAYKAGEITSSELGKRASLDRKALTAVTAYDRSIRIASDAIKAGQDAHGALATIEGVVNSDLGPAITELLNGLGVLPPGVSDKVQAAVEALRLVLAAIRSLIADAQHAIKGGDYATV